GIPEVLFDMYVRTQAESSGGTCYHSLTEVPRLLARIEAIRDLSRRHWYYNFRYTIGQLSFWIAHSLRLALGCKGQIDLVFAKTYKPWLEAYSFFAKDKILTDLPPVPELTEKMEMAGMLDTDYLRP